MPAIGTHQIFACQSFFPPSSVPTEPLHGHGIPVLLGPLAAHAPATGGFHCPEMQNRLSPAVKPCRQRPSILHDVGVAFLRCLAGS